MATIDALWEQFRYEHFALREYPTAATLLGQRAAIRQPLLEQSLPGLLLIRAVAILDHALAQHLSVDATLFVKLKRLRMTGTVVDHDALDRLRITRNGVAHTPSHPLSWSDLVDHLQAIEATLVCLGLTSPTPELTLRGETQRVPSPGGTIHLRHRLLVCAGEQVRWSYEVESQIGFAGPPQV